MDNTHLEQCILRALHNDWTPVKVLQTVFRSPVLLPTLCRMGMEGHIEVDGYGNGAKYRKLSR